MARLSAKDTTYVLCTMIMVPDLRVQRFAKRPVCALDTGEPLVTTSAPKSHSRVGLLS